MCRCSLPRRFPLHLVLLMASACILASATATAATTTTHLTRVTSSSSTFRPNGRKAPLSNNNNPLLSSFAGRSAPFSATRSALSNIPRGGSTAVATAASASASATDEDEDDEDEEQAEQERIKQEQEANAALQKWRAEQQILLNLRSTFLSEALAKRGLPLATVAGVSTAEGDKPPDTVDWDCAMSTHDEPKTCLYSFDAEPNTKVVAPLGTTQWISLSALNRLRRTDPAKVEPMWHSRYAVLRSWFSDESEFSFMQHAGVKGFLISNVLLDLGGGVVLRSLVLLSVLSALVVAMPALEYIVNRLLVSAPFWARWYSWHRIAHAALPFKLLVGQIAWKQVAKAFAKVEGMIRDHVVDMECSILEDCVPLTVGRGAEVYEEEIEDDGEEEELDLGGGFDIMGDAADEEEEAAEDDSDFDIDF